MTESILVRDLVTNVSTTGRLFLEGALLCFTLEDPVRIGVKIPGATAIPHGRYRVVQYPSPRHGMVPRLFREDAAGKLIEVEGFTYVEIHPGNSPEDTRGCILLGKTRSPNGLMVHDSRRACREYGDLLDSTLLLGRRMYLTIINPPSDLRPI